jgi:hypothetical protein
VLVVLVDGGEASGPGDVSVADVEIGGHGLSCAKATKAQTIREITHARGAASRCRAAAGVCGNYVASMETSG